MRWSHLFFFFKSNFDTKKWPFPSQSSFEHTGLIDSTETDFYDDKTLRLLKQKGPIGEGDPCLWSSSRQSHEPRLQEEVQKGGAGAVKAALSDTALLLFITSCFLARHH